MARSPSAADRSTSIDHALSALDAAARDWTARVAAMHSTISVVRQLVREAEKEESSARASALAEAASPERSAGRRATATTPASLRVWGKRTLRNSRKKAPLGPVAHAARAQG